MDALTLLEFMHVTAAVLWVGGGFAMILSGLVLARRSPAEVQLALVRATVAFAPRLFVPASMITLASGLTLLFVAGWGWQPFTILGLLGVLFTAGFGMLYLGPACERALKIEEQHGASAALPLLRRVQRLGLMDYTVQFAIVFLMVVKPAWEDLAVLGGLGVIVAAAALATLRPLFRTT